MKQNYFTYVLAALLLCFVSPAFAQNVAKIGETEYATLSAAISAATAGQTITLIDDVNENVDISKNLTIDGAEKTYTGTMTWATGKTITVQNVNFVNGGLTKAKSTNGNYTIKNCTFDGAETYSYAITLKGASSITVENCSVKNYNYGFLYVSASLTSNNVKNVTVENCNYGVRMGSTATTNLVNFVTKNVTCPVQIQSNAGRTVNMTDCSITEVKEGGQSLSCWGGTSNVTFNFKGTNKFDAALPSDANFIYKNANGDTTENIENNENVVIVTPAVAMIGETGYETLAAAIQAASAGQTVTLLANIESSEIITINKAITLDGNGKTLTSTAGRAINVDCEGNVGIKNLTINASGERAINIIQKPANVTIENVTATAANYTVNLASSAGAAKVAISNSTLNGLCTVNVSAAGAQVTVVNSTVNCNDNNTTAGEAYAALCLNKEAVGGSIVATNTTVNVAAGSDSMKGRNGAENGTVTINGSTEGVAVMVAAITYPGSDYYHAFATLEKAIEFAKEGNVITLIRDVTMDYNARDAYETQAQNVVIDGNGKILTLNQKNSDWASFGLANNSKLVLKNMTIEKTGYGDTSGAWNTHAIIFSCPVEMTNVTVNNSVAVQAGATLNDVIINEANGYYGLWINGNGQAVTVNGGAINATNGGRGIKIADQYIDAPAQVTLNVDGTVFNTAKKAAVLVSSKGGAKIAAANVNIENVAEDPVNFVWVDEDWAQYFAKVEVTGATVAQEGIENFVASINGACYKTLAEAIAAATADQTITLIADVVEPKTVVFGKALKIDGAGHTFKGAIEFKSSSASYTIKNVNFDGEGTRVYALKTTASTGTLTVENCTCTNYTYGFLYANRSTTNLKVKNVTVEGVNYGVHSVYGTNITLDNYHAIDTKTAVYVQNYGIRNVTLNNCTFEGCENPLSIWERNQTNKITFTFKGVNDMGKADFCTSGMAVIKATAMIGTKVYETLQAAVDAAQADETVTLLADAAGAGVVINKNIAIDFNGKTYTVNKAVGSKGTETLGFQILKNNSVTLKNGTLKSTTVVEGKEVKMLVQNYASLNLVDMNLVDETEHIQYVLSNNSGNTELSGNTNITTDAVAFDSYFSQSYTAPTVTVETTGKIEGKIEKNDGATIAIKNGTYTMDVTAWCAAGYMCEANADGTYGITRANIKVGDDKYFATMEEAIAAIGDGDVVIELLADATLSYGAREAYGTANTTSVTINGNGHTLTLDQTNSDWSSFGLAAGKVAFNNMTIEKTGHGDTSGAWNKHAIIFSSPVEMNNVTVNNSVAVQAGATLNNVTINEANGYYGLWINGNGQTVTVNGGAINATNGGRGIKIADQYIDAPAQVTLNVDGTKFNTAKKAAVLVSSTAGANITANDVNIEDVTEDQVNFVWVDEKWAQYFGNVTVNGAPAVMEDAASFVAAVTVNGAVKGYYATLADAIAAVQDGEAVELVADINESVTIDKNLTIDGKGKNYTGTMTGNDNLTITVQNVNFVNGGFAKTTKSSKGVYTFVGCTFVDNGTYDYPLSFKGANTIKVENCTVNNYQYGFLYVSSGAVNVSVKNVTVEGCPNYAVYFASGVTNIPTIEGLSVKNANNGILINNTTNRKLTIKDCQMENVTTAINHSKGTSTITVNAEGSNNFGGAAISKYVQINGTVDGISNPVAKIGETEYNSLSEAFDAAQDGETVTLIKDVVMDTKTLATQNDGYAAILNVAGKAVTLDLNGKNITVDAAAADLAGAKLGMLLAVFSADLGGHLTLTDNSDAKNGAVTLNVNDAKVYSMFASESGQSNKSNSGKITVNGGNYTTVGKVNQTMFFADANEVITVNGGNFHCDGASTSSSYPWMFNTVGNNELHVTVNGGTFNVDVNHQHRPFEVYVPETLAVKANGDGTWTVVPSVAYITEMLGGTVHEAGSRKHMVGYATLADAIEAAEDDEPVTLAADATGAGVVINKDVTIDFNGKTYTVNKAVGSKGTETLGFQILKNNSVTLKNGTLKSTAVVEGKEVKMLIQNYANLSLVDMNLVDETDHILYVLSNNCGDSYVGGNTNITTDAVAFDSYYSKSYNAPMVTVETEGKIAGAIEKNDGATIAIMSGTFTAEILPEWCAEYYVPVQNEDGTWTVVDTYVKELTFVDGQFTKFENDIEKTVGTLTYKRKFNNLNWNVIYLPFEVPMAQLIDNYEVAYFYDVHSYDTDGDGQMDNNINVEVVKISKEDVTLKANYPYMIRAKNDNAKNLEIVLNDATLYPSISTELICQSVLYKFEIVGNHETLSHAQLNDGGLGLILSGGKWGPMNQAASLKPWRVYLKIAKRSDAPWIDPETFDLEQLAVSMTVRDENGANGIENSKFELNVADSKYYDLMGRVVEHPVKGRIYIVNGKKVVY